MVTLGEPTATEIDFGAAMRVRRAFSQAARGAPPQRCPVGSLVRGGGTRGIELQGLVASLAGELGVTVAKIRVGGRVARMAANRLLKRAAGLFVLSLGGVNHRQVVVGLRQIRI